MPRAATTCSTVSIRGVGAPSSQETALSGGGAHVLVARVRMHQEIYATAGRQMTDPNCTEADDLVQRGMKRGITWKRPMPAGLSNLGDLDRSTTSGQATHPIPDRAPVDDHSPHVAAQAPIRFQLIQMLLVLARHRIMDVERAATISHHPPHPNEQRLAGSRLDERNHMRNGVETAPLR